MKRRADRPRTRGDWAVTWPVCTGIGPQCDHDVTHPSSEAADEFARQHMGEYVNLNGYAVCGCHDGAIAARLGVAAFPCDQAAAVSPTTHADAAEGS